MNTSPVEPARLGVCYYPEHWDESLWAEDASRMRESGILYVRIGEFAWTRMEPDPGKLRLDWLDRAIETLGTAGLRVVMCTPTATPPKWLVDRMPDMLAVDAGGQPRRFGSRRHYDFSHQGYIEECRRITRILGERFGRNRHVAAWQLDNEYGCHETVLSFSDTARDGFRLWLQEHYTTIGDLNQAWGNVFWSMEYRHFGEIDLPSATVTEANPAHWMDFRRFASDKVVAFNKAQADILRELSPGRRLIHNFMGRTLSFDHFDVSADLDVASWDAYPLGFLERFGDTAQKERFERQGDPDFQAFHHDLYRACAAKWWVMELQPGPVNWAPWNPAPRAGMVRLWGMEAAAHGAEVVSYFRWRQAPFAQEQMHAGLLRPDSHPAPGLAEATRLARDLDEIGPLGNLEADVALLFDYTSAWAWEIQPQGRDFDYFTLVFECYRALRAKGLSIDVLRPDADDWGKRKLVIVPGLFAWSEQSRKALAAFEGVVMIGPRSGSKTRTFQIPAGLGPDLGPEVMDIKVTRVESRHPGLMIAVGNHGHLHRWREDIEVGPSAEAVWRDEDDMPVLLRQERRHYLAGWPTPELWLSLIDELAAVAGIDTVDLPAGLRLRHTAAGTFAFNYDSQQSCDLAALGLKGFAPSTVPPAGCAFARSR